MWLARNKYDINDKVLVFEEKPILNQKEYWVSPDKYSCLFSDGYCNVIDTDVNSLFDFVTYENSPMEVELKIK